MFGIGGGRGIGVGVGDGIAGDRGGLALMMFLCR
jgi:hypothetical protein